MNDIEILRRDCNHFVNGDCRTLACHQPDGTFSCPTKRVDATIAAQSAEIARLREALERIESLKHMAHPVKAGHEAIDLARAALKETT